MNTGDDLFTGEYFVSLKGYKIPHKSSDKSSHFDINNPPPPGTEEESPLNNDNDSYVSPLAAVKRPSQPKFEVVAPVQPQSTPPNQSAPLNAANSSQKPSKRSSLFMTSTSEGLPEELIKLFKPLCCDLCSAKLNSPTTARLHYESKNHEKKINNWLSVWAEKTGEPIPKRPTLDKGPVGPNALHCDVCDLALTSLQHAKQHNMGKRHKNALAGRSKPGGPGYYDSNNKWVRTTKINEEDPTNRFAIGEAFLVKKETNTETVIVPESVLKSPPPPPPPPPPEICNEEADTAAGRSKNVVEPPAAEKVACEIAHLQTVKVSTADLSKYCEICDISVTSEMHMRLHLSGAKHAKKLRQLGEPPYTEVPHTLSQCILDDSTVKRAKNGNAVDTNVTMVDYSVFRTPSGQYYCQVCDLSVTSEITLSQHFASKRHIKTAKKK